MCAKVTSQCFRLKYRVLESAVETGVEPRQSNLRLTALAHVRESHFAVSSAEIPGAGNRVETRQSNFRLTALLAGQSRTQFGKVVVHRREVVTSFWSPLDWVQDLDRGASFSGEGFRHGRRDELLGENRRCAGLLNQLC